MQRGVIEFSIDHIQLALNLLEESPQRIDLLKEKLISAQKAGKKTTIELSEDEIDILLDIMPAPNENEEKHLTELRKNLQKFLMRLRDKTPKQKPSFWKKLFG